MISQYKFIVRCFWASILLPSLVLLTKQSISKIMADASKHKKKVCWFITISSQKFTITYPPLQRLYAVKTKSLFYVVKTDDHKQFLKRYYLFCVSIISPPQCLCWDLSCIVALVNVEHVLLINKEIISYDAHPKVEPMIDVIIINFLYRVLPTALVA